MMTDIDRQIAEKVMGWEFHQGMPIGCYSAMKVCESSLWAKRTEFDDWFCVQCNGIPSYSTNISDAWLVVERVRTVANLGLFLSDNHDGTVWEAAFQSDNVYDLKTSATADTAPVAICLAALKAVDT